MSQKFILHAGARDRSHILANCTAFLGKLTSAKSWVVEIKQYRKTRSNDQNEALWGLAYPIIAKALGEDVNTIHEYMLGEHFGWIESVVFGKRKSRPARTTTTGYRGEPDTLSTVDFASYFDFIQRRAGENGVHIPDPNPAWREAKAA